MCKLVLELEYRCKEGGVDKMDEELQVLTKSGRLVDGEGWKHRSGSPCKKVIQ